MVCIDRLPRWSTITLSSPSAVQSGALHNTLNQHQFQLCVITTEIASMFSLFSLSLVTFILNFPILFSLFLLRIFSILCIHSPPKLLYTVHLSFLHNGLLWQRDDAHLMTTTLVSFSSLSLIVVLSLRTANQVFFLPIGNVRLFSGRYNSAAWMRCTCT